MEAADRTDQILDSSLAVFCRYGFSKTTMKDLADAAGISRASLYLHFNNKEELFRAGSERAHATVMSEVETKLHSDGSVIQRITEAMTGYLRGLLEEISASPHGHELFNSNLNLSSDIAHASRERMSDLIAAALSEADRVGAIDLSVTGATSSELAGLIMSTVEGIKATGGTGEQLSVGISLFMRILGEAISR